MKKYRGGCECGNIRYSFTGEPSAPHFCHCDTCQRSTGAPVVAWVSFPVSTLQYEGEKPASYVTDGITRRGFCPKCGTSIYATTAGDEDICITTVTLDNPEPFTPEFESYKEDSPSWMNVVTK